MNAHELFQWAYSVNPRPRVYSERHKRYIPKDMTKAEHEAHMAEILRLVNRRLESHRWEVERGITRLFMQ